MATMMMKTTMMVGIAIRMIFSIGFLVIKFGLMGRARSGLTRRSERPLAGASFARINNCFMTLKSLSTPAGGWLERLVRSSQLIAIHILLIGNNAGSRPIPPDERETD